jgi:hypothetical protein
MTHGLKNIKFVYLPVLCMGVKLSHASQKEYILTVSGNKVPRRTFG